MRISERMGLVYTALFLTVSVAVITHNSDSLMSSFSGSDDVFAVDDVFIVNPGRDQRLFVLTNDQLSDSTRGSDVRLVSMPECGRLVKSGGNFVYTDSLPCAGHQEFRYCVEAGSICKPARVVLELTENRPVVDSIAVGPDTSLQDFNQQVDFNGQDLEITNVHLGKVAGTEDTSRAATGAKLIRVATDAAPDTTLPTRIAAKTDVSGSFDLRQTGAFADTNAQRDDGAKLANNGEIASDATPKPDTNERIRLPDLPRDASLPMPPGPDLAVHLAAIDLTHRVPETDPAIDRSPFGTPCASTLTATAMPDALVELRLNAPCRPNSRVEIYHGKLLVTYRTSHSGDLVAVLPALSTRALFLVRVPGEVPLKARLDVPEAADVERVAIQWQGGYDLDLHALEFGATPGSMGHVWEGNPRGPGQARQYGGGYMMGLGDTDLDTPIQAEVYSYPRTDGDPLGVVELTISAAPDVDICGKGAVVHSHRSRDGRMTGSTGLQFRLPECGDNAESIVLKNAVEDLIIAGR